MEEAMPVVFAELARVFALLENHYRDMQDIEFTVEDGRLWMLQTRSGKRTAKAALKIAVDMADEGLITEAEAVLRVEAGALDQLLHPTLDPKAVRDVIARGLPASPGAAAGAVVFDSDEAETRAKLGEAVILVRTETSPEDIHGMHAARGILTARGGMTSHAAVVARGMGRPCVSGAGSVSHRSPRPLLHARRRPHRARGRTHHARWHQRRSHARRCGHRRTRSVGRFRQVDGLGRQASPVEGAHQRRNARPIAAPRAVSAPKASGCAAPSTCSSNRAASPACAA